MAAPIDFAGEEGLLQVWTDPKYFDVDALIDAYGNCPAAFLQACFQMMKPMQNYYLQVHRLLRTRWTTTGSSRTTSRWSNGSTTTFPSRARPSVNSSRSCTSATSWCRATFKLGDVPVRPGAHRLPSALADRERRSSGAASADDGHHAARGEPRTWQSRTLDAGHVGLAVSSKAHKKYWPEATKWIAERSTAGLSSIPARRWRSSRCQWCPVRRWSRNAALAASKEAEILR